MAKTKISEFSTTPGNNTDINGINISEGCPPSGINNAIRELMSDLKEWQSGAMDVYVIPQGTAAAPGIQLYGDLDTGLYGYAANQLGVAVGGASAGYFSSAGWVGNVNGTITGDINATTIDTTNLEVTNIKAKDGTAAITIADSTGVVSVSTTLDLTTVEVTNIKAKDGTAAIALTDSTGVVTLARTTSATNSVNEMLVLEHYSTGTISAGFGSGIKFFGENTSGGNSVYAAIHAVWEGGIGDPSGGALVFLTDGYVGDNTERVRITSEGKVGIGTATPSTTLEVAGSATVTGATTLSATTQNIALGTSQTTGTWTAGGASQTGALTLDQSTKTHTLNLGTGATESGLTKTVNIGTGGVSTSTTAINIGSANGTSTTLNGTVTAATLNSTTIDTTNIEVTNIKAKDGTAALSIADSTGVVSVSANPVLSGGTANGVVYLNASKVATSGSALVFDGTNLSSTGGATFQGGPTGYGGGEVRLGTAASGQQSGISTLAVDSPVLFFDHRGSGNTGVFAWRNGTGSVNELMRLTSTGLGIGENNPAYKVSAVVGSGSDAFFADGNAQSYSGYRIRAGASGQQWAFRGGNTTMSLTDVTVGSDRLIVDSSGNVGIGTITTTNGRLNVQAGTAATGNSAFFSNPDGTYNPYLQIQHSSAGVKLFNGSSFGAASNNLIFGNAGTSETMRIDGSGNLGLGVTPKTDWSADYDAFQLGSGSSLSGHTSTSLNFTILASNQYVNTAGTSKFINDGYAPRYLQRGDTGEHYWYTTNSGLAGGNVTNTQAMTLDASGRLLVGPTSAASVGNANFAVTGGVVYDGNFSLIAQLTNDTTAAGKGVLLGFNNSTNTGIISAAYGNGSESLAFWTHNNTSWGERARVTSGGDLLVGTQTLGGEGGFSVSPAGSNGAAQVVFDRANTTNTSFPFVFENANTTVGTISYTNTATAYNTTSDYRLKDNPQPLTGSGAFIDALKPKTWDWKLGGKGVGFIAHEVAEVSPGTVVGEKDAVDADGKPIMQAMEYGSAEFIANIIAELQSLRARVAQLEGK